MTKSQERGANEYTEAAKRESARTGRGVCDILAAWLAEAKQAGDVERVRKVTAAQKFSGCRNRRKRGAR
jgi:hypothetical protein